MKYLIIIFFIIFLGLLSCSVNHKLSDESFYINVDLGGYERDGKDFIQCWINDSLVFSDKYVDKYGSIPWEDMTIEQMGEYSKTEIVNIDKTGIDSIKIRLQVISLDTILFAGKERIIDTTFHYQVDNIPGIIITIINDNELTHFLVWDTLRTPDYFEYEY